MTARQTPRETLATTGGSTRPPATTAPGTKPASFAMCRALAESGGYREIHVYQDPPRQLAKDLELALPRAPRTLLFEKVQLPIAEPRYGAIYVAYGEQISSAPHVLRPPQDWAPFICSLGTAHIAG